MEGLCEGLEGISALKIIRVINPYTVQFIIIFYFKINVNIFLKRYTVLNNYLCLKFNVCHVYSRPGTLIKTCQNNKRFYPPIFDKFLIIKKCVTFYIVFQILMT